jgi:asparagine synthase (glutamine-hydrolysing)
MLPASPAHTNQAVADDPATDDWVLRLRLDGANLVAEGVSWVDCGPISAFVDGILFDRDDLAAIGHQPKTSSDAALIAAAYARTGEALFPRLRGSFVVAIVDRARRCMFVVRDPLGSHPLYRSQAGDSALFASSIQALLKEPGVSRELNRPAIADQLCRRWPQTDETLFSAVRRVPPGCRARLTSTALVVERYWNTPDEFDWLTLAEAQRFDEHLDRAVRRTLSAGPTGVFLSGGFDSVSVAAVATDLAQKNELPLPRGLSLAFPDPLCDERHVQASVAKRLGLSLALVDFDEAAGPRGLLDAALELNRELSAPLFNSWMPAYLTLVKRGRSQGVRTIITGEGGDEWLGVSLYLTADLLRRGEIAGVVRFLRTLRRSFDSSRTRIITQTLWTYGLRPLAGSAISAVAPEAWDRNRLKRRVADDPAWIAPDPAVRAEQRRRAVKHLAAARPKGGFYARDSRLFLEHPLMSWLFEEQFHFGSRLGVRYLHPYWDADLLDHLYRVPPEILNRGDRAKGLVRESVGRRFPGLGFETQRKVTAHTFYASILGTQAPPLLRRFADFSGLGRLGIVEPEGARRFVEGAFTESPRVRAMAWNVVNLESWVRAQGAHQAA